MTDPTLSAADIADLLRHDAEQRQVSELAERYGPRLPDYQRVIRSRGGLHHLRHEIQVDLARSPAPAPPPGDPGETRRAASELAAAGPRPGLDELPAWRRWLVGGVLTLVDRVVEVQRHFNHVVLQVVDRLGHDLAHERRERLFRNEQMLDLLEAGEVIEAGLVDVERRLGGLERRFADADRTHHVDGSLDSRLTEIERRLDEIGRCGQTTSATNLGFPTTAARDAYYLAFEDRFRGEASVIRQRLEVYRPLLDTLPRDVTELAVDLGAGRGEWLDLVRKHGFEAIGVDSNARMVEACRERQHDVTRGDALDFLAGLDDDSAAIVTAFHVIEHLSFDYLVSLVDEILRVLAPGGVVLFETPNPENVSAGACYFYMDFTHVRPLPPLLAKFLLEQRGYVDVEIQRQDALRLQDPLLEPLDAEHPLAERINPALDLLNQRFLRSPDYAVLGRKSG